MVGAGGLLLTDAHPADAPPAHPSGGPRHEQEKAHSERAATMPRPVAPAPEGSATAHDAAGGAGRAAPAARSFGWAAMWVSVGIAAAVAWPTLYQAATHVRHAWARQREREMRAHDAAERMAPEEVKRALASAAAKKREAVSESGTLTMLWGKNRQRG